MDLVSLLWRHRLPLALAAGFYLGLQTSLSARLVAILLPSAALLLAALLFLLCLGRCGSPKRPPVWRESARLAAWSLVGLILALGCLWRLGRDVQSTEWPSGGVPICLAEGVLDADAVRVGEGMRFRLAADVLVLVNRTRMSGHWMVQVAADGRQFLAAGTRVVLAVAEAGRAVSPRLRCKVLEVLPPAGLPGLRAEVLAWIRHSLDRLPDKQAGLALALLIGQTDGLADDIRAVFYQSGCAHLVALSGMHVALVAGILVALGRRLFGAWGGRVAGMAGAVVLIWLVGPFPSALRALAMFLLWQLVSLRGYRCSLLACLLWSGPLVGVLAPGVCLDIAFRLSFWALLGILTVQEIWKETLRSGLKPWLAQEVATGLSAQFATLPVLAIQGLPIHLQGFLAGIVLAPLVLAYLALSALLAASGVLPGLDVATLAEPLLSWLYSMMLWWGSGFVA